MPERILLHDLFGERQDFDAYAWEPFRPGVEIARVYGDGQSGPAAALLRYAPGARVPAHDHLDYEHIIVVSPAHRERPSPAQRQHTYEQTHEHDAHAHEDHCRSVSGAGL